MTDLNLPGDPIIPLVLRRSARARRISLRVSSLDGRVTLTIPEGVADQVAVDFAAQKEVWIRKHLQKQPVAVQVGIGTVLPIDGVRHEERQGQGRTVFCADGVLHVSGRNSGIVIERYLKELARERLVGASDLYAARLGQSYSRITLRDTRSRWGSCSSQKALMYSWRLILAPPQVLRYVAAHEVAHLVEMNHSAAFWNKVSEIFGDYAPPRKWLRLHGAELHRYRFR